MTEYRYSTCPICGIQYAVDKLVMEYKERTENEKERGWTCPNGHNLVFKVNALDEARRQLDRAKQQIARAEDEAREARQRAEAAERREMRLKKRAAAGTCPCCQRSFSNMGKHMLAQHPEFVEKTGAKVIPIKRSAG